MVQQLDPKKSIPDLLLCSALPWSRLECNRSSSSNLLLYCCYTTQFTQVKVGQCLKKLGSSRFPAQKLTTSYRWIFRLGWDLKKRWENSCWIWWCVCLDCYSSLSRSEKWPETHKTFLFAFRWKRELFYYVPKRAKLVNKTTFQGFFPASSNNFFGLCSQFYSFMLDDVTLYL